MSKAHAEDFHARMHSDPALRDAVTKASDEVLKVAKKHNLHFTRDELAAVLADHWKEGVSDEEGADPATSILSERPGF